MSDSTHQGLQLRGDLRQAIENWVGDRVDGPWEIVIDTMAKAIEDGALLMSEGARLDMALGRTTHKDAGMCEVCDCPCPGMSHG